MIRQTSHSEGKHPEYLYIFPICEFVPADPGAAGQARGPLGTKRQQQIRRHGQNPSPIPRHNAPGNQQLSGERKRKQDHNPRWIPHGDRQNRGGKSQTHSQNRPRQ